MSELKDRSDGKSENNRSDNHSMSWVEPWVQWKLWIKFRTQPIYSTLETRHETRHGKEFIWKINCSFAHTFLIVSRLCNNRGKSNKVLNAFEWRGMHWKPFDSFYMVLIWQIILRMFASGMQLTRNRDLFCFLRKLVRYLSISRTLFTLTFNIRLRNDRKVGQNLNFKITGIPNKSLNFIVILLNELIE